VFRNTAAHGFMGVGVRYNRKALTELQRSKNICLTTIEVFLDTDGLEWNAGGFACGRVLPAA
jgi:hypothetical protein